MHTHPNHTAGTRLHPLLIAAAVAVILFCAIGTAAIMGWLPSSSGSRGQLNEADRAALAAGLQQPGQPGQPGYPAAAGAPVVTAPALAAQATPVQPLPGQALAATPAYAAGVPVTAAPAFGAYGSSGTQGGSAYGGGTQGTTAYAPAEPVDVTPPPKATRVAEAEAESGTRWCATCGNVESIRQITRRAQGSGVGAAGGAILGGLLGNQVGGGHGRQLATVAGAVGGAVMGNQVEGNMKATHSYEIRVRLDDGTLRTFHQQSAPRWRNGDRVRIVKGALRGA